MKPIRCRLDCAIWCEYFKSGECTSPVKCKYQTEHISVKFPEAIFFPTEEAWEKMQAENSRLTAENAELRARLEKAVELPVRIGDPMWYVVKNAITPRIVSTSVTEITIYEDEIVVNLKNTPRRLVLDYNGEVIGNYYEIYLDKNSAEARLKELQGGER